MVSASFPDDIRSFRVMTPSSATALAQSRPPMLTPFAISFAAHLGFTISTLNLRFWSIAYQAEMSYRCPPIPLRDVDPAIKQEVEEHAKLLEPVFTSCVSFPVTCNFEFYGFLGHWMLRNTKVSYGKTPTPVPSLGHTRLISVRQRSCITSWA
jgi:hypothetical protein